MTRKARTGASEVSMLDEQSTDIARSKAFGTDAPATSATSAALAVRDEMLSSTAGFPAPASARAVLLRGLRRNVRAVAASFALLSVWQLSEAMVPVVVGGLIDSAVVSGDTGALIRWGLLLALVFVSLMFSYRYGALVAHRMDQREAHRVRTEVARHVLRPAGARTGRLPGSILSLATGDADGIGTLTLSAGHAFASVAAVIVSAVVLLRIDVVIGLTVLLGVPLVVFITQMVTPSISRLSREQRGHIAATSAAATDLVQGLRAIKGIGAEDEAAQRYRERSQIAKNAGFRVAGSQGLMKALSIGLSGLLLAVVAVVAGERALEHSITIGQLISIVGLTLFLAVPIQTLGQIGALVADAHASAFRVAEFLHTPPLLSSGTARLSGTGAFPELTFDEVTVSALRDFTLASRAGELLCLAIDDAAATSILIRLLTCEILSETLSGGVRLDGTPIAELSIAMRRQRLLVNPHRTALLHGTLRSNLDPDGKREDAELAEILGAVAADDIARLDERGLDQPVSAKTGDYSGGQRQRIALARALAADSPILVLDNPTTAVDPVTEQKIAHGIRALRHQADPRTTWIITTSPTLLAVADRVVFVKGGRMGATGTHQELLRERDYEALVLR